MSERRRHGVLLMLLTLTLSAFLFGHAVLVQIGFEACFGNYAASLSGERPYLRVAEMSFGRLVHAAGETVAANHLIIAAMGLLPLSPLLIAWRASRNATSRQFWLASTIIAFAAVVAWTAAQDLTGFYDCDRNGVSLGLVLMPLLFTSVTAAAALALAGLRYLVRIGTDDEGP